MGEKTNIAKLTISKVYGVEKKDKTYMLVVYAALGQPACSAGRDCCPYFLYKSLWQGHHLSIIRDDHALTKSNNENLSQSSTYDAFYSRPSSDTSRVLFKLLLWAPEASHSTNTRASMDEETVPSV